MKLDDVQRKIYQIDLEIADIERCRLKGQGMYGDPRFGYLQSLFDIAQLRTEQKLLLRGASNI